MHGRAKTCERNEQTNDFNESESACDLTSEETCFPQKDFPLNSNLNNIIKIAI